MDRRRLNSAAVALLSVVVVGLAASTLGETTTRSGAPGADDGSSGGIGIGGGSIAREVTTPAEPLPILTAILIVAAVLLVLGTILFPRHTVEQTAWAGAVTALILGALWLFFSLFGAGALPRPAGDVPDSEEVDSIATSVGAGSGGGGSTVPEPLVVGLLVAGLLCLGVLGLVVRESGAPDRTGATDADEGTLAAIGRSAGRAADRIAEADAALDNEVYRAWKEMTDHLDLDSPDARTPEEFRAAARDAGMTAADVDALTDLFREVRYGGAPPTDEREVKATDALRQIEDRYAEEGAP